jgi:hypothetical protein
MTALPPQARGSQSYGVREALYARDEESDVTQVAVGMSSMLASQSAADGNNRSSDATLLAV